jgi:hypothetical protein
LYNQIDLNKFKITYPIKYQPDSRGQLTRTSYEDDEFLSSIYTYINKNAQYTRDLFIKEMRIHIPKTNKNVENKIKELTTHCEKITPKTITEGTSKYAQKKTITEGTSKYAQKKFKQHNTELAATKIEIENLKIHFIEIISGHSSEDN